MVVAHYHAESQVEIMHFNSEEGVQSETMMLDGGWGHTLHDVCWKNSSCQTIYAEDLFLSDEVNMHVD